ncbi:DET1- and DDB1-associated protein 1-like [Aristolochia californica]|uniref:DET1- and DDB1-associated protein 1-like n=1 Tax=Aristolochia californica TaxID=171875 RepID=UPI0035DD026B
MGSLLENWPSYDPHNFSQLRPSDPDHPFKITPVTYHPTHNRTVPPPNQVISTEATHILLRHIYKGRDGKLRLKRAASEHLTPEHGCKQPRGCLGDDSN